MAKLSTDGKPSTSRKDEELNHMYRMSITRENPSLIKSTAYNSDALRIKDQHQSRSCVLNKSNDQITVDIIEGRRPDRPGHISDDGTCVSSRSSDSRWRNDTKGKRLVAQPDSLVKPQLQMQRSHPNDHKMVPHSSTVSYSSSKSSTHLKQETSRISHNTSIRSEGPVCRICHEGDQTEVLISPCYCAGSMGLLHVSCLQRWLGSSNKTTCEICNFKFTLIRKAKPIKEFLRDPGTARDKKNLVCDIISFLSITPLTVLTTWVSIAGAYDYYENSPMERGGLIGLATTLWFLYLVWFLVSAYDYYENSPMERGGLIGLATTLWFLYLVWFLIAARHNWRLWKDWAMFHQDVTLVCSPNTSHNQKKVDGKSDKLGSCSTLSSVHLEGIQITVSSPTGKHKRKRGTSASPKLTPASKSTDPETLRQTNKDTSEKNKANQQLPPSRQIHRRLDLGNVGQRNHTEMKLEARKYDNVCARDRFLEDGRISGAEVFMKEKKRRSYAYDRYRYGKSKSPQFDYYSDPERGFERNTIPPPLWEKQEHSTDTRQPASNRYSGSTAIFSRGNSPEDSNKDKTASQKYMEDWLDLKAFEGERKRDGSDLTSVSYQTCMDGKSSEKKDM